jgi:hypothetical protein
MFEKAIQKVAGYTCAIHSISRNFGSTEVQRGAATLFFINQEGSDLQACIPVAHSGR